MNEYVQVYKNALADSDGANKKYLAVVEHFVNMVKSDFSESRLKSYINALAAVGYQKSTIVKFIIPTLRRFYKVNKIDWPIVRRGELPTLSESDVRALALHPNAIKAMIAKAKSSSAVYKWDTGLLALATTYGMRRVEMASVTMDDIDFKSRTILVKTAKLGRERIHLIPKEIIPYMLNVKWREVDEYTVHDAFSRLEEACGMEHINGVGWHSIRRSLVRMLTYARLPTNVIDNFMRWKRGSMTRDMQRLYFNSTVVGGPEGSSSLEMSRMDTEVDELVFENHPFIKEWTR